MPLGKPLHQWPAGVQSDRKIVPLEDIEKRLIGILIRLLENAVEIADRLMIVQDQAETNRIHGRGVRGP